MHVLDLIMYFPIMGIIWLLIDKISEGEFTNELGTFVGIIIMMICTLLYIILFAVWPDWNWIDIFKGIETFKLNITW